MSGSSPSDWDSYTTFFELLDELLKRRGLVSGSDIAKAVYDATTELDSRKRVVKTGRVLNERNIRNWRSGTSVL